MQRYCTIECRIEGYRRKAEQYAQEQAEATARMLPPKPCDGCGNEYQPRSARSRFCTEACRSKSRYVETEKTKGICVHCGLSFLGRPQRKYCGPRCAKKANRKRTKALSHKDRCRVWHRRYEAIDPYKVFERDNWMCGICFAPVDRDTVAPDPLSASLDHRIPLSKGGNHVWDNVRCAHFGCNSIKSDKLDEEIVWPEVDHQRQPHS